MNKFLVNGLFRKYLNDKMDFIFNKNNLDKYFKVSRIIAPVYNIRY